MKMRWIAMNNLPIFLGFCPGEKAWDKTMRRLKISDSPYPSSGDSAGHTTFFSAEGRESTVIVTIADFLDSHPAAQLLGVIAHEATHVWQEILRAMGEERPSPEFEAYTIQYIFQTLLSAYNQTRRPKGLRKLKDL